MTAQVTERFFKASDGADIFVQTVSPDNAPKAALHIHHGLAEHVGRYAAFAQQAAADGFLVVMHDARGHGRTSQAKGAPGLGHVQCGDEGPVTRMATDLAELLNETAENRPGLPIAILGHSAGTMISRWCLCGQALSEAPDDVFALCLSAPPARLSAVNGIAFRGLLASLAAIHGGESMSKVPGKLSFDKYQAHCVRACPHDGPVTGWEWLNRDGKEVQLYIKDEWSGHEMSLAFWREFVPVALALKGAHVNEDFPEDVKVAVFLGTHDFCGIDDSGVLSHVHVGEELATGGHAGPKVILYPGARHELLLEENRDEVTEDILGFVRAHLPRASH